MATLAWIGIGANLGEPAATVREAIAALGGLAQSRLITHSSLYASAPLGPGVEGQPDYVNAVAALDTALTHAACCANCCAWNRISAASAASATPPAPWIWICSCMATNACMRPSWNYRTHACTNEPSY